MKYAREIKVGALATICLFLLFFGFNYLKGVNIFSPTNSYHGVYTHLHGMEEQAAVYIRGHKVGQVDAIHYDFTRDSSFTIDISVNRDISLPQGTQMALIADGLLGGMAVELQLPSQSAMTNDQSPIIEKGSFLPTAYVPGLFESVQNDLLAHVDEAVQEVDSLVAQVRAQIAGNHLQATLENVDRISGDLTYVSADIKQLMQTKVPAIVSNADTAIANLNAVVADLKQADLKATVARVDTAVDGINSVIADVRDQKGTLGQLLYNKSLYTHIDAAVITADSLLTDLKAHPKRYVHFSLFGKKDK
jgi:phospholipid/cholesterol/gamma-HCH transport system substrate-binding protein